MSIDKGVLYIVATPIGNRGDISQRAIDVLRGVDLIAAEDTRHSRPLLRSLGVDTALLVLHDHNEQRQVGGLLERLKSGGSLALISDAGTPLVSDPGFSLVRECHRQGVRVSPVPGPCAAVAALSAAGLATDRFLFVGFPARTRSARQSQFRQLSGESATLVFYESSHRILDCLSDMQRLFGPDRPAAMARELTKIHETIVLSRLEDLEQLLTEQPVQRKGEFVLMVAGYKPDPQAISPESRRILQLLCQELPLKQSASLAAQITGEKKNRLYRLALEWQSA